MLDRRARRRLGAALAHAQQVGLLGPGPVEAHLEHAAGLAAALTPAPDRALDLGSGGGVPGLVLAVAWTDTQLDLLDVHRRSVEYLRTAIDELHLGDRVRVLEGRAEVLGRDPGLRGEYDLVVARGFGSPAVTAECGAPFLRLGGRLVVTEPPGDPPAQRWPALGLEELGLSGLHRVRAGAMGAVVLTQRRPLDDRWPRRTGIPRKRPLWPATPAF